jgi:hypothetical protein
MKKTTGQNKGPGSNLLFLPFKARASSLFPPFCQANHQTISQIPTFACHIFFEKQAFCFSEVVILVLKIKRTEKKYSHFLSGSNIFAFRYFFHLLFWIFKHRTEVLRLKNNGLHACDLV